MARIFAVMCLSAMLFATAVIAAEAHAADTVSSVPLSTDQQQLHDARAEMRQQRAQSDQLKARVGSLEKQTAANRNQFEQRDREIADLQRKLDALQRASAGSPAVPVRPAKGGGQ